MRLENKGTLCYVVTRWDRTTVGLSSRVVWRLWGFTNEPREQVPSMYEKSINDPKFKFNLVGNILNILNQENTEENLSHTYDV